MRETRHRARLAALQFIVAALLAMGAVAGQAATGDLFRQTDRFDQADKADLAALIRRANGCIRARDFSCVDQQLQAATKLAFTSSDKQQIATVKQAAAAEKKTVANEEAAARLREQAREQADRNAALLELCQRSCPIASQAYMCVGGSRTPESCDASQADYEARTAGNNSVGDAVRAAGASVLADHSRISRIHNNAMANIQAQQNDRLRREQDQRAREQGQRAREQDQRAREQDQRADAEQRAREKEAAQRVADRQARESQLVVAAAANAGRSPATATQAAPGKSANAREGDEDGCIEAIGWCSTPPALEMKGRTALLRFKNTCPFRVYGNFYNGLSDGRVDGGASGVAPGATHTWSSQDGSGRSFIRVIGSAQSGKDWVCQGKKLSGFTVGDSTLER